MGSAQEPPEPFEAARPRLLGLAYRMLGSRADAEDVVQEAWLRWHSSDQAGIARPEAWLTTTATRLALDRLRTVRRRREEHLGPWLPEPILTTPGPEDVVELAETLTLGFLTLLDRLDPLERAVVLLADVFDVDFADIAESVGRTPAACRQIASRARRRLRGAGRERVADHERRIVGELLAALLAGDAQAVIDRLAPEVTCLTDLGALRGGRHPVRGAERVARYLLHHISGAPAGVSVDPAVVNGEVGLIWRVQGAVDSVVAFEVAGDLVSAVRIIRNPDKLQRVAEPVTLL